MRRTLLVVGSVWVLVLIAFAVSLSSTPLQTSLYQQVLAKFVSATEVQKAQQYIDALADGHVDVVASRLAPTLSPTKLKEFPKYFPAGRRESSALIGFQVRFVNGLTDYNISFEERYPHSWVETFVNFADDPSGTVIAGAGVYPSARSLEDINALTVRGKSAQQLLFLILSVIVPTFVVLTITVAIRTPIRRRKWLWIVFVAVGFTSIQMNWTTGQMGYLLTAFSTLGGFIVRPSPYSPWILTISLPIGAIVFWIRRPALMRKADQERAPSLLPDPA